jgi:alcohol dehydrogenase (cytochrome c)
VPAPGGTGPDLFQTAASGATLDQLWHFNVGSGINAPPMTFEVNGRQYIAIQLSLNRNARNINSMTPELREMHNQTMLFVFGLRPSAGAK